MTDPETRRARDTVFALMSVLFFSGGYLLAVVLSGIGLPFPFHTLALGAACVGLYLYLSRRRS